LRRLETGPDQASNSLIARESNFTLAQGGEDIRWTVDGGFQDLGLPGIAYAVSSDGGVVVGSGSPLGNYNPTAFRWTQAGGMEDLGTLPGFTTSTAIGVSDDGQVVVGTAGPVLYSDPVLASHFDPTNRPFVWTAATGMQDLNDILAHAGVGLTGITLLGITGVSNDGKIVSCVARTPLNDPNDPYDFSGFIAQSPQ
jgi:probable HAF family extracellular repeat protein